MSKKSGHHDHLNEKSLIGWKEWCALPILDVYPIRAKIDTGAKTSALHAVNIETYVHRGMEYVRFKVFPHQHDHLGARICRTPLHDYRYVMSSNGHREKRFVIQTTLVIGSEVFDAELTLTNRAPLVYRMLIGREALKKRFLIDPSLAHEQGRPIKLEKLR